MQQFTKDHLAVLLKPHMAPCISVYQPTHRSHPDNLQDLIRYRNILRQVENSLLEKYRTFDSTTLLEKFRSIANHEMFWNHRTEGLCILASPEMFQVFELQTTTRERIVVGESFHITPLLHAFQAADRYQILALNRNEARLFEGNRNSMDAIELTHVPSTIEEALGEELTEPHQSVASYGKGDGGPHAAHGQPRMYHGHGSKKDQLDIDRDRFFRSVDRGITQHHSRPTALPLILAALTEHHAPFHEVSRNPYLLFDGILTDPFALSSEELCREAWRVFEPIYRQRIAKLVDDFETARAQDSGTEDLGQIREAAAAGRIDKLLIDSNQEIAGRFEGTSRRTNQPGADKVDELAEIVLRNSGEVIVVDTELMPADTGAAAILRYSIA